MFNTNNDNNTPEAQKKSVSNDFVRQDSKKHSSTLPIQIAGSVLVVGTAVAVVFGSRSAVASMNAGAESKVDAVKQAIAQKESDKDMTVVISDDGSVAKYIKSYDFTTEQLNWAHENHIRWDDNGNPVDEKGFVVDDPTTPVNEIERAKALNTIDETGKSKVFNLELQNTKEIPSSNIGSDDVLPGESAPSTINGSGAGLG